MCVAPVGEVYTVGSKTATATNGGWFTITDRMKDTIITVGGKT